MCRPPDLNPASAGFEDGFDPYSGDGVEWNNEGNLESGDFEGSDVAVTSLLGKRELNDAGRLSDVISRAAKLPRAAAPVTSAFDSAAASFMVKMEQSMLHDLQRQQQQRRLAAAAAEGEESLLLQRALMEQRTRLQQLQQLQLLKQLQRGKQVQAEQSLGGLLVQQQLLQQQQQSQSKLLDALNPAAAWPALGKPTSAPMFPPLATPDAKIQGWMAPGSGSAVLPGKALPALQPKPAAPTLAAAAAIAAATGGADLNPASAAAAAMFGLGPLGQSPLQSFGIGEEKKVKRMQSNRASAKRSRQRRQARLEELDKTTAVLQTENSTMCAKLEEAQQEILALEVKNKSLQGEVSRLRKMLGMEVRDMKNDAEAAMSGGHQQSCVESEGGSPETAQKGVRVKAEAESEVALAEIDEDDDDENEDQEGNLDWLGAVPFSPSADGTLKPGSPLCGLTSSDDIGTSELDQLLVQGEDFSELLACLNG